MCVRAVLVKQFPSSHQTRKHNVVQGRIGESEPAVEDTLHEQQGNNKWVESKSSPFQTTVDVIIQPEKVD